MKALSVKQPWANMIASGEKFLQKSCCREDRQGGQVYSSSLPEAKRLGPSIKWVVDDRAPHSDHLGILELH
jgi:hypothetical protein